MEEPAKSRRRQKIKDYIDATSKSPVAGVIYALFFWSFRLCLCQSPEHGGRSVFGGRRRPAARLV
jgi:hypothetical protein